jgi:cytochrome b6-f complex iron-sulfur subunit
MERRNFIKTCCITIAGGSALTSLSSCGAIYFATAKKENGKYTIAKSEFIEIKNEKQKNRKFVLLQEDEKSFPICVYRIEQNKFQASLLECTHQGCELNVGGGIYSCPCHGSEFSTSGKLLEGPAERDLKTFKTEIDNENIYVYLD